MTQETNIIESLEKVKSRIRLAAKRSGRDDNEIDLVAVTKQKSAAVVKALVDIGVRKIGESYLQEANFKMGLLTDPEIEWHMIGNIQRGKEKHIASLFHIVHSVGSKRTAHELNEAAASLDKVLPVFIELNVSGESTKYGWQIKDDGHFEEFLLEIEEIVDYSYLNIIGLMTMAPYAKDPEMSRPFFRRLRAVRDFLIKELPGSQITGLSMGMSGDFEVAIEEGATILRIGSALVGQR